MRAIFPIPVFLLAGVLTSYALLSGPSVSQATFPGTNGKLAWESYTEGVASDIYVMDPDGGNPTNITNNPGDSEDSPDWSPDGTRIVFARGSSSPDIWVMDANGGNQMNLAESASNNAPGWSPNGTKIVFGSNRDGNGEIYVMDSDGTDPENLTKTPNSDESQPDWSPDGTKIAFVRYNQGDAEIYVMDANGSNQTNLSNNAASDQVPSWSPDGSHIAFWRSVHPGDRLRGGDGDGEAGR